MRDWGFTGSPGAGQLLALGTWMYGPTAATLPGALRGDWGDDVPFTRLSCNTERKESGELSAYCDRWLRPKPLVGSGTSLGAQCLERVRPPERALAQSCMGGAPTTPTWV